MFTPPARALADGTRLAPPTVPMVQVMGHATPPLSYQAAPIVVATGMGGAPARDGIKLGPVLGTATFAVLASLDDARFRVLGRIG